MHVHNRPFLPETFLPIANNKVIKVHFDLPSENAFGTCQCVSKYGLWAKQSHWHYILYTCMCIPSVSNTGSWA